MLYEIRHEQDAVEVFDLLFEKDGIDLHRDYIQFMDWPEFRLKVTGGKFDQEGVPTRVMRSVLDIQRVLDRLYVRSLDRKDARHLKKQEWRQIELVVLFESGSLRIDISLSDFLNQVLEVVAKIDSKDKAKTIIGIACVFGGVWAFDSWLNHHYGRLERIEQLANEARVRSSIAESEERHLAARERSEERYKDVIRWLTNEDGGCQTLTDLTTALRKFGNRLDEREMLHLPGATLHGGRIQRINPDEEVTSQAVTGMHIIYGISWSRDGTMYRLEVSQLGSDDRFFADVKVGELSTEEAEELWAKARTRQPVYLELQAQGRSVQRRG
ncbi:MAG: hypothetical protein OXI73_16505 [Rhodospirillales bacterium]|nr:hypothetical protein [Rhodospirillales bacterium]